MEDDKLRTDATTVGSPSVPMIDQNASNAVQPGARRSFGLTACLASAAVVGAAVFVLAFVLAPKACDGGLGMYFWCGVASLVILLALPFVLRVGQSLLGRVAWSVGLVVLGVGVWVGGLAASDMRIICRLF